MKEEKRKSKKKVLLYYLILAACLLVIAAVTVTVVFTVRGNSGPDISIDNPGDDQNPDDQNPDDNKPGESDNPGGDQNPDDNPDDKPTGSDTSYGMPLKTTSVTVGYEFSYDKTLDLYRVHQGMDFECTAGDEVYSVLDGTVTKIVKDSLIGENYVIVTHANGITSTYKYMLAGDNLAVGQSVKRGDVLGKVAEAAGMEMNQGDHLHFVITVNGKSADPDTYLNIIGK